MALEGVAGKQQYVVFFPDQTTAKGTTLEAKQTEAEKALSNDLRQVVTLSDEQLEALRSTPGVRVYLNTQISFPPTMPEARVVDPRAIHATFSEGAASNVELPRGVAVPAAGEVTMTGTDLAAPAVTGALALILAHAKSEGIALNDDQTRQTLLRTWTRGKGLDADKLKAELATFKSGVEERVYQQYAGTSMAQHAPVSAPMGASTAALVLEHASREGIELSGAEVAQVVLALWTSEGRLDADKMSAEIARVKASSTERVETQQPETLTERLDREPSPNRQLDMQDAAKRR